MSGTEGKHEPFYLIKLDHYYLIFDPSSTQVLICSSFCNEVYDSCKTAEFGGKRIGDEYKNGHDFCKSQDFKVAENNQQCFSFDPTPFSSTHRPQSSHIAITTLLTCSLLFNKLL